MNQLAHRLESIVPALKALPQLDCTEKHHFGPGIYVKEVTMPAGALIVGKSHKVEHLCVMLTGRMRLINDNGEIVELTAPITFVSKPGRKVAYILETVVFQNIYSTEETDIEKLEYMFIEQPALEQGH